MVKNTNNETELKLRFSSLWIHLIDWFWFANRRSHGQFCTIWCISGGLTSHIYTIYECDIPSSCTHLFRSGKLETRQVLQNIVKWRLIFCAAVTPCALGCFSERRRHFNGLFRSQTEECIITLQSDVTASQFYNESSESVDLTSCLFAFRKLGPKWQRQEITLIAPLQETFNLERNLLTKFWRCLIECSICVRWCKMMNLVFV